MTDLSQLSAEAKCDGRGNCRTGACATVISISDARIVEVSKYLGEVSNNIAEYEAVILTLIEAKKLGISHLHIYSDSKVIVHQIREEWKITHPHLRKLRDKVWEESESFIDVKIFWIPREQNEQADRLCHAVAANAKIFIRS